MIPLRSTGSHMRRLARRRRVSLGVLFALVWMQLALAGYACPALAAPTMVAALATHDCERGASEAPGLADPDNPNLCLQHALQGDQRVDSGPSVSLSAPGPGLLIGAAIVDLSPQLATLVAAQSCVVTRATAPPKSIVHCCFRI
jgi:hypothetical protein